MLGNYLSINSKDEKNVFIPINAKHVFVWLVFSLILCTLSFFLFNIANMHILSDLSLFMNRRTFNYNRNFELITLSMLIMYLLTKKVKIGNADYFTSVIYCFVPSFWLALSNSSMYFGPKRIEMHEEVKIDKLGIWCPIHIVLS